MGKKRKAAAKAAKATKVKNVQAADQAPKQSREAREARRAARDVRRAMADERRALKMERRRKDRGRGTDADWALPAPAGLIARLEKPKVKLRYHSYFEFAENAEKKKKLEFQVTNIARPPPGFKFVAIGDPTLTNACKELSRARDAMIFIVSSTREENRVSDHVSRMGYHFRESIVDDAIDILGETAVSRRIYKPNEIEPIPKTQDEINKQADAAIRDLFPRIPNTDRQMVIDHAFKKGALFHGQPVVGLAPDIPLSRRVQLAVLAHIRHTHTRYDLLLRETEWMNARKVVEPVCLDILVKWRGDEETGRDQLEEILREVVVITDSEESSDSLEEEDSSEEEGEADSASSSSVSLRSPSLPNSRNQRRSAQPQSESSTAPQARDKKAQRGFQRYRAAWDQALTRQQNSATILEARDTLEEGAATRLSRPGIASPYPSGPHATSKTPHLSFDVLGLPHRAAQDQSLSYGNSHDPARHDSHYVPQRPPPVTTYQRDEVTVRPLGERQAYYQTMPRHGTASYAGREQPPPVVVRASPTKRGLQDILVPSIEMASSDAVVHPSHSDRQHEFYRGRQEAHPERDVERSVHSPSQRQIIFINDDSPLLKRRREVYEDDAGRFRRRIPRDQDINSMAPRADSHSLPASSIESRDFLVRRERLPSQSAQAFFRDVQPSITHPVDEERLPIYDAPPDSAYFTLPYDRYRRRPEVVCESIPREGPSFKRQVESPEPYLENRSGSSYARRPVNGAMRAVEHDRAHQPHTEFSSRDTAQRPLPPAFPVSSRVSRSYEMGREPAFLTNFSQSRLEEPLPRARDDFNGFFASSHQNSIPQSQMSQRFEDRQAETSTSLRSAEAWPPLSYMERPLHMQDERPVFYGHGQGALEGHRTFERPTLRERREPEGDSPQFVRTVRRPVIVLD